MTITKSDLLLPVLPGAPKEWTAPDDLLEAASETIPQSPFVLTPEAAQARELIAARRFYLVKNEMRERSRLTGNITTYMTTLGVERPFNGIDGIEAWLIQEIDPDNTDPSTAEMVRAIVGQWVDSGRIEPISEAKAKELSFHIFMASNGRIDVYANALRKERR